MPANDFWEIVGWALACSVPVVLAGAIIIRLARSWSLAVSMVALVLIPTLATFTGVLGASGFMITETFERTAVVLVIVSVVTIPAAVMLARYQARRTVWEQEIRDSERAAEQSRRRLVAFVSHDLRTPLAGIRAVSEAIADGVVPDSEVRVHAKTIEQESIRLSEMVDDLFEMSKINAGAVQPAFDKVALDEVVDDVLAAHRIAAERAGVALKAELPDKPVRVLGSDRALVRVLSNLVANAIAHTPEGGKVSLALGSDENGAWARVDDTGSWHQRGRPAAGVRRGVPRVQRPGAAFRLVAAQWFGPGFGDRRGLWCRRIAARCRRTTWPPVRDSRCGCRWRTSDSPALTARVVSPREPFQDPGTPLSSWLPRSANAIREPSTSGGITPETSTSRGPASAMMRAAMSGPWSPTTWYARWASPSRAYIVSGLAAMP